MSYRVDESGKLNNFAVEPKMYQAEPATADQKRNLLLLGAGSAALVVLLIVVASAVS
jgi:hypothetical protein